MLLPPDSVVEGIMFLGCAIRSFVWSDIVTTMFHETTFKLSVTLSNLNRFSKFWHGRKAYEICYKTQKIAENLNL